MAQQCVWVGGYTPDSEPAGTAQGIYRVWLDDSSGRLTPGGVAASTCGPSFLAVHPSRTRLYAVNEHTRGGVAAFAITASAELSPLGRVATGGAAPCHIHVLPGGRELAVSHYGDGTVAVVPLTPHHDVAPPAAPVDHGAHVGLGPDPERQDGPHAHCARLAPDGRHLLVTDLGTDELRCYVPDPVLRTLEYTGSVRLPPGTGPRHLAAGRDGRMYVVGELDAQLHVLRWRSARHRDVGATVTRAEGAEAGILAPARTSLHGVVHEDTLPAVRGDQPRSYPGEVAVSPCGRHLYVSNRGADCVSTFALDGPTPRHLADVATGGAWPRHFALVGPHGQYLVVANQFSDQLTVLRRDPDTGIPVDTGHRLDVPSPAVVLP
ncbi:lactonase family protein [Lipingzhangella sp. LS1_29]|uniref:Lactonase family protein n=1 Tax=Lipingzhangella rawalii TaxID=2055835 RepID=A0ABU2H9N1_9ACTN|nr:lactonase family protein [Lipingzhangella rawalii]MDS1271986.1 lactonase family protein [Lipingzhangella rawalii]